MSYVNDNINQVKYERWLDTNVEHLEHMYVLSGLDCGISTFSRYVYDNSVN